MNAKPIKTEAEYLAALKEIECLMDAEPHTSVGDRLDVLATLVEAWEEKHLPIEDSCGFRQRCSAGTQARRNE
jgi:HTH-type transcriptional regulator / antitoxin HigA